MRDVSFAVFRFHPLAYRQWIHLLVGLLFLCSLSVRAQEEAVELSGYVARRAYRCFEPEFHDHPPLYFVVDDETGQKVQLVGVDEQLEGIHPKQKVQVTLVPKPETGGASETFFEPAASSEPALVVDELTFLPLSQGGEEEGGVPDIAGGGANSLTMLTTLLVFADSQDNSCMTSETNARNLLFDNANNANEGMQAITKGRYGIQLGNGTGVPDDHSISITLDGNSSSYANNSAMESAILSKVFGTGPGDLGLNRLAYDRILLFPPSGYSDAGFTAYAYYPYGSYTTQGMVSMYGNSYGNSRMNGYLHELGHNFEFAHSSKGGSEYGDRTCVMGLSNNGSNTETYNITKLMQKDWLDTFNNNGTDASITLSQDITVDLYPLSSDLTVVDQTIGLKDPSTNLYVSYHRDDRPYGYLSQSGDRNKVFVHNKGSGNRDRSFQVANLSEGGSYTSGNVHVLFGQMGASNTYATVSFDVDDGNTMPQLTTTTFGTGQNQAVVLNMPTTDADGDTIAYVKLTDPSNGVLSGSFPNLTYTPNTNFTGSDSFRITASDALISNFITVTVLTFVDTDVDGLEDSWEIQYFGDLTQGPTDNPDNDQDNNLAEFQNSTDPTRAPTLFGAVTGTVIGTTGSYLNDPSWDRDEAWDGSFSTYYDALNATGDWTGLDLGTPKKFAQVRYAARSGWGSRMNGGQFQGSNTSDFSSGVVTFHTVNTNNTPSGSFTTQEINDAGSYRYIRYIGPTNGYCNIAEIEFIEDGAPDAPTGFTAVQSGNDIDLDWDNSSDADFASYSVYRGTSTGVYDFTPLASGLTSSQYTDTTMVNGTTYYYVVVAVDSDGLPSPNSNEQSVAFEINDFAPLVEAGPTQNVTFSTGVPWTPAQLPSLAGWYDATDASTITESGGAVSQWNDKSGNGLHLSQGTAANRPLTGSTTINGLNAIDFDGSNDDLAASTDPFGGTVSDAMIIMVHKVDSTANGTGFSLTGSGGSGNRWQAHIPYGGQVYFDTGGTSGSRRVNTNYSVSAGDNVLVSFYSSTTDNVQEVYKNGTYWVGDSSGQAVSTVNNIHLGSDGSGTEQNTSFGEVIIINGTVSDADRENLEGYLAHKWGLESELPEEPADPVTHPYKATPPGGSGAEAIMAATTSDPDGNAYTLTWTKVSGPGNVTFSSASSEDPTAYFDAVGTYVLQLEADDGTYQTTDTVTINVTNGSDSDSDGMDDAWETANFGDLTRDGTGDFDNDGVTDLDEFNNSTDPTTDDYAPAAPTGLAAIIGDGSVDLDWDDSGASDFASYSVYRSTTSGSGYSLVTSGLTASTFLDTTVTNDTTYYYVVTAIDTSANESSNSSEISATPVGGLLVSLDGSGNLVYETYANEGQLNKVHTVPDFSRAGYGGGGVEIPFVGTQVTLSPSGGDDTTAIQNAIDTVSALPLVNGFRGAVLLQAGEYSVSSTLNINASGVVIRGAGQQESGGTRITFTATTQIDLFHFHGSSGPSLTGSSTTVTDSYVPVGSKTINVGNASTYAPGDLIRITYLMNQQWVDDIGMTVEGGLLGTESDPEWDPAWFQLRHYRYVESVSGNEITLDAPIVQTIETQYGGASVQECTYTGAIENVGIENIRLESTYTADDDELHGWEAIEMRNVVNGWIRQVTGRYFGQGLVLVDNQSKFVTVEDSASLDPKSITTGGRKYSFNVDDSGYNLVQRTLSRGARHDYATGSVTPGPNVFVDSHAIQSNSDIGPHFRWATGELYDNIKTDNEINVQNRLNAGTTHGWAGAQIMFWNVNADSVICDAPTGAMNWSIGTVGTKSESPSFMSPWEPFGIWQSEQNPVAPRSLYYAQLKERLGVNAMRSVILPQQESGTIWTDLQTWDGNGLLLDGVLVWYDDSPALEVGNTITIGGRIRDLNMMENLASTTWSKVSGPGVITFGNASNLATTMSFSELGTYEVQLEADDGPGGLSPISSSFTVVVTDPNELGPPQPPTGLAATPGEGQVSLDWDVNGASDLASYNVYRSTTSGSYGSALANVTAPTSSYVDTTAVAGTTYFYVVTALDGDPQESGVSNEMSAVPLEPNIDPAFTTDPVVELDADEAVAYTSSIADNAADGNTIPDPITFSETSGPSWLTVASNGDLSGTPGAGDVGLNSWTIVVDDGRGGTDTATLEITVIANQDPTFTTNPVVETAGTANEAYSSSIADNASDGDTDPITFSKVSGPGWLNVALNGVLSGTPPSGNTGLNTFTVRVEDDRGGSSDATLEITVNADVTAPAAPTGLSASAGDAEVILSWNANGEADLASYSVYRSTTSGSGYTLVQSGVFTTSYIDTTAVNETQYFYVVRAVDGDSNESSNSNEDSATPTAVTNVTVAATDNAFMRASQPTSILTATQTIQGHRTDFRFGGREAWIRFPLSGDDEIGGVDVDSIEKVTVQLYATVGSTQTIRIFAALDSVQAEPTDLTETSWTGGTDGTAANGNNLTPNTRPIGFVEAPSNNSIWLPVSGQTTGLLTSGPNVSSAGLLELEITGTELEEFKQLIRDDTNLEISIIQNGSGSANENFFASVFNTNGYQVPTLSIDVMAPDVTAPAQPTGLVATAGDGQVSLDWGDNVEPDLDTYTVYRSETSGSYGLALQTGIATSSFVDSTAVNGTTYYYVVTATDTNSNESVQSVEDSATPMDSTPPAAPTGLVATAGDNSVSLNWDDNGEGDLADYTVYRSTTSGSGYSSIAADVSGSAYVDNSAVNGTTYYYVVSATDTNDNESAQSSEYSATPVDATPPAAPTGFSAIAADSAVILNWVDNSEGDLADYTVYRSTTSGSGYVAIASEVSNSNYNDTTAVNGTTYYYVVTADDSNDNESAQSSEVSATPMDATPPAAPTGLAATAGDGEVTLNWDDNGEGDLADYTVYRSTTSGSGYSAIATDVPTSSYTDSSAVNGTTYYYVVSATDNSDNESSQSSEASATPSDDTDGDGIEDAWEIANFGNLTTTDGTDPDPNGVPYFFVYLYGPTNVPEGYPGFTFQVLPDAGVSGVKFHWAVKSGFAMGTEYMIEYSTNLDDWFPLILDGEDTLNSVDDVPNDKTMMDLKLDDDLGYPVYLRLRNP